jgi:hypothetical protein
MKRFASAFASSALLVLCLAGCGHRPDSGTDDDTASIVLALTTVPSDVSCLEVTVTGAQTTVQRFDVTPNQAATITVPGLASGAATISERAFAVPCAQVTATTTPTWLSTMAVPVTLTPARSRMSPSSCGARVRCASPPISRMAPARRSAYRRLPSRSATSA